MMEIQIGEKLRKLWKTILLGCIEADVEVGDSPKELWDQLNSACQRIANEMKMEDIVKIKNIMDGRAAYRRLGNDPTRYRLSSEALLRRIVKERELYQINSVVDINNLISISSCNPVCAYDLNKLQGPICFTVGETGESYEGIGRGNINIENLPVFTDRYGAFGSTTSDSERAMVSMDTTKLLLCIVSFNEDVHMDKHLEMGKELLEKYARAHGIEVYKVR
ncbi:DNA/RNA-binding domain of Phe-tRNA-synthetase-like protein [Anaerosolibacter carboniphilus]|uniref:DNA/RNA-binding domain of Phe-tRNA-synthetase-like protein n=1 Tax=Anaerosolibacter carboniphilus TaxID=1417629 RepID=A0A841KN12_9FIRM|nr:phenylalanine--tRNA ligase beta subunit-related protein [Anaerosolibacter carboniphilus]MBB6214661.1 DNA/RNA-binding domain of Phe-tRNA-synthetase-like protein [Anaerosolibacter carboniphilus]